MSKFNAKVDSELSSESNSFCQFSGLVSLRSNPSGYCDSVLSFLFETGGNDVDNGDAQYCELSLAEKLCLLEWTVLTKEIGFAPGSSGETGPEERSEDMVIVTVEVTDSV